MVPGLLALGSHSACVFGYQERRLRASARPTTLLLADPVMHQLRCTGRFPFGDHSFSSETTLTRAAHSYVPEAIKAMGSWDSRSLLVLFVWASLLLSLATGCGGGSNGFVPSTQPSAVTPSALPGTPTPPPPAPPPPPSPPPTPAPPTLGQLSHVIVVVMQNNSFDHLFGTYTAPAGNTVEGLNPSVIGYQEIDQSGNTVTPYALGSTLPPNIPEGYGAYTAEWDNGKMDKFAYNDGDIAMGYYDNTTAGISTLWNYANQYSLADHYFQSSWGEAPTNQLYMVAADDNDRNYDVNPYYPPCHLVETDAIPYTFQNVADQLFAKQISWGMFQEDWGNCASDQPLHNAFQYFTSTNTSPNIQDYANFSTKLQNGTLPAVSFVIPSASHDMHPGYKNPVSDGINFLDELIKEVQASTIWPTAAIIITFDTGGGWYDHVPPPQIDDQGLGFRVPTLVISPLAKQGYVSHKVMDHVSILKLIQWNWGLPSLNARNDVSGDMLDMFKF